MGYNTLVMHPLVFCNPADLHCRPVVCNDGTTDLEPQHVALLNGNHREVNSVIYFEGTVNDLTAHLIEQMNQFNSLALRNY